jgi:hypothetical protein
LVRQSLCKSVGDSSVGSLLGEILFKYTACYVMQSF